MSKEVDFRVADKEGNFDEADVHIEPFNLVEIWQVGNDRIQLSIPQALAVCSQILTALQEQLN
jgi:hypothetical protein